MQKLPLNDYEDAASVMEKIIAGGPKAIVQLVVEVGAEFGDPDGVQAKYALHGLVCYAGRPNAEKQRKLVASVLAGELGQDHSDDLKAFLCRQLQLCGGDAEVPALAKQLDSDVLCEPATQALCAIASPAALSALRKALPTAEGDRRATLIGAAGRFQDRESAGEVVKDLEADDADLRTSARQAAAAMGDGDSADTLRSAVDSKSPYVRGRAIDACLLLARRLAEQGDAKNAEKLCRDLLKQSSATEHSHHQGAALATLADVAGTRSADDVVAALADKNLRLRHHAAEIAMDLAVRIQSDNPKQAKQLAEKAVDATDDEVLRRRAAALQSS